MTILNLTLYGDPIAKGRPRIAANGHAHTPERTRAAERAAVSSIQEAMVGKEPVSTPVGIHVEFFCATRRGTDFDNLTKLVTDAMNELVYVDDKQIEAWSGRVHRGVGKKLARTELRVWELVLPQVAQIDALPGVEGFVGFLAAQVRAGGDDPGAGAVVVHGDDLPDPPDETITVH